MSCPLDCPYLQEARKHDKPPEVDPSQWPNQDVRVTDQFLAEHYPLFAFLTGELLEAGLSTPGAVDLDVREALDALIRTYRTRQSGLYYDSRPNNLLAAGIYQRIQQRLEEFERKDREQHGLATVRDLDVLGILVFLQRLERQRNNGRRRGRAFLDFLRSIPALRREVEGSEEPRLILP